MKYWDLWSECGIDNMKQLLKMMERTSGVRWVLRTPETTSLTDTGEMTV